jgi:DNA-binding protein Fis
MSSKSEPLSQIVRRRIKALLDRLGSHRAPDLYRRVIREVERTLRARIKALGIKTKK